MKEHAARVLDGVRVRLRRAQQVVLHFTVRVVRVMRLLPQARHLQHALLVVLHAEVPRHYIEQHCPEKVAHRHLEPPPAAGAARSRNGAPSLTQLLRRDVTSSVAPSGVVRSTGGASMICSQERLLLAKS